MSKKKNIAILLSFIIFSLLSVIILIHTHVLFGASDMQFHIKRIAEWNNAILHGLLLPEFSFNYFHGSAVMSMYPYLSMLPFIVLLHITSSFFISYYSFFVLVVFSALLLSFYSSYTFNKSITLSYMFSVTYSMSSLFTFKMFTDGDLGVVTSLVFLPLVIFGFLNLLKGSTNYLELTLGLVLMSFCQITAVIIVIAFLLLWMIVNLNKRLIINLSKIFVFTILLTSIIWLPLLRIVLLNRINTVASTSLKAFNIQFFIENMNVFAIITIIIGFIYIKHLNYLNKQMYILSIIVILCSSKLMPWHIITLLNLFKFLNQFQFTFRFLIIPQILLSYIFSVLIFKFLKSTNRFNFLFPIVISVIILPQIMSQFVIIHRKFSLNNISVTDYQDVKKSELEHRGYLFQNNNSIQYFINGYFTNKDYFPQMSNNKIMNIMNNKAVYGRNQKITVRHSSYNQFSFNTSEKIKQLFLPLLCYNGEHLRVYVNHHLVNYHVNKNNLITLSNVKKGRNVVGVKNIPNVWLILTKWILFLNGIIWLLYCFNNKIIMNIIDKVKRYHKPIEETIITAIIICLLMYMLDFNFV